MKAAKNSSLLAKYSELYRKNPKSRVFAPLAQTYRKLGMLDDALRVLNNGIKRHPTYVMGYIALAHCYFDQGKIELAYTTIRPFVSSNLENISLQKLFAKICLKLDYREEALETFKYLLLLNPRDEEVARQVRELEDIVLENNSELSVPDQQASGEFGGDTDEWIQVDFTSIQDPLEQDEDSVGNWNKLETFKEEVKGSELKVQERNIDDEYYFEEYDNDLEDTDSDLSKPESEAEKPIITHTLVDLYVRQGYTNKAVELLQSILDLHPDDIASRKKLESLKKMAAQEKGPELRMAGPVQESEEEDLAGLVEQKVKKKQNKQYRDLENALNRFLFKVQLTAQAKLEEL